jgi:hypothetical protein
LADLPRFPWKHARAALTRRLSDHPNRSSFHHSTTSKCRKAVEDLSDLVTIRSSGNGQNPVKRRKPEMYHGEHKSTAQDARMDEGKCLLASWQTFSPPVTSKRSDLFGSPSMVDGQASRD